MMNLVSRLDLEEVIANVVESSTAIMLAALAAWLAWTYIPSAHGWAERLVSILEQFAHA
jgi:hypothetical protein